jgi:hypothetical protein
MLAGRPRLVGFLLFAFTGRILLAEEEDCGYYLAPSIIPNAGLGVFAGRNYSEDEFLALGISLVIPSNYSLNWQLNNYVYSCDHDEYSMVVFGIAVSFIVKLLFVDSSNRTLALY